jgi:hypothetical protein
MAAATGVVLAAVAGADMVLRLVPPGFGQPEWEVRTMFGALNELPLLLLGLTLMLAAAAAQGRRLTGRLLCIGLVLVAVAVGLGAVLLATAVPRVVQAPRDPELLTGLRRNVARASVQAAFCFAASLWIAWRGWRHFSRP